MLKKGFLYCVLLMLSACATTQDKTLYDKLGGEPGMDMIVNNLVQNIGNDKQIFHYFAEANVTRFKEHLARHLCDISDGPCDYKGDSMKLIHDGMDINERDFNHLVDLLIDAMYEADVPHPVQNQLLARLAPLRKDIIYR
ncbi:group I truncated hemoglobin [Methylophaga sp.]|uniref:group I truncated hemoglobin n=1 Tax=Methylophaga sp. TaxID=2024840 RepID=UPI003F69B9ED